MVLVHMPLCTLLLYYYSKRCPIKQNERRHCVQVQKNKQSLKFKFAIGTTKPLHVGKCEYVYWDVNGGLCQQHTLICVCFHVLLQRFFPWNIQGIIRMGDVRCWLYARSHGGPLKGLTLFLNKVFFDELVRQWTIEQQGHYQTNRIGKFVRSWTCTRETLKSTTVFKEEASCNFLAHAVWCYTQWI